jgi:hypothetical protein
MSIAVTCPNGHSFKVKDKFAGKQGLCPFCKDRVTVLVPEKINDDAILDILGPGPPPRPVNPSASVLDDDVDTGSVFDDDEELGSTMSLVGRSAVRHQRQCPECSQSMPYWFAKCPACGKYVPNPRA